MAASLGATLNGHRATSARVQIPKWGLWYADVSLDGEITLKGAVTLQIADLTLKGTIIAGGPAKGRSSFRVVAGAGGWGKTLPKKSYANDAGVKVSTVLGDAAREAGETLGDVSGAPPVGASWTRARDSAARLLEQIVPGGWYVDEAGVTRLGARAVAPLAIAGVTHGPVDRARGTVTLASESIAKILPGVVVDGLEAVDVAHEMTAKGGLRTTIWGAVGPLNTTRALAAFRVIFDQLDPNRKYRGTTEYRVSTQEGERLNLQPIRVSSGMPDLRRVYVRPGMAGLKTKAALGARVLVGFIDSDPSRPYVTGWEDAEGGGFSPLELDLDALLIKAGQGSKGPIAMAIATQAQVTALQTEIEAVQGVLTTIGAPGSFFAGAGLVDPTGAALETAMAVGETAVTAGLAAVEGAVEQATSSLVVSD